MSSAAAQVIRVEGTFTLKGDASVNRPDRSHQFQFEHTSSASDPATVNVPVEEPTVAPVKPQRVTANTTATQPSQIPRSCPTDTVLAKLVTLIEQTQAESDRYLTEVIKEDEAAAGNSAAAAAGAKRKKPEEGEEDGNEDNEDSAEANKAQKI